MLESQFFTTKGSRFLVSNVSPLKANTRNTPRLNVQKRQAILKSTAILHIIYLREQINYHDVKRFSHPLYSSS